MGKATPPSGATSIHDLTDDLLELVLLSLDSPVCLVRSAASCKHWRRIVVATDGGAAFLRRFRSLHSLLAIGTFYSINIDTPCSYGRHHTWPEVDPVFVPSSACPSDRLQLSLDFVPPADEGPRELADGRGSLLLLLMEKERTDYSCHCCYHVADYMTPDLVVCEPLTQRYQAIPLPAKLVCILGDFLLDGGMTDFRVLLMLYQHDLDGIVTGQNGHGYPSAMVFTLNGGWHHGRQHNNIDDVYWGCDSKQVMVLDERTLEFSNVALSDNMMNWSEFGRDNLRVVSAGDGATVRIVHVSNNGGNLEVFRQGHGNDWVLQMSVQLVEASRGLPGREENYFGMKTVIIDAEEGFVVLSPEHKTWLYSVDLETMELKREYGREQYTGPAYPYTFPWPPVMRACV
ncbi:unnamed protein product [Urochloa decumbens]|uniref:F-box protein AT5G49610-like beta-propeller domain-containing protein n=1 Tax=Urochloa decumbens TaxID=240449 RepID=A0ABC9FRA5_9POAL